MKRILFVDDEPKILQGLKRMLRSMRNEWDMEFAESGPAALELMNKEPFNVVVTDMRMPGMSGAELLAEVMKRYPDTIRLVLSGQSSKRTFYRALGTAHQFLSKPCNADAIKATIARAFALRDLLESESLKRFVSQMVTLPSISTVYTELMNELKSEDPSIQKIGQLIEQDMGMSAKILQVVNSSFFGVRRQIVRPRQAAVLIGLDTIRSLVCMVHIFSQFNRENTPASFSIEDLWKHSTSVGRYSMVITKHENGKKESVEEALTAGLLHDVGKLVFAANLPEEYSKALDMEQERQIHICEAEKMIFGSTHAEVGAYLLGLWGVPESIVEAVAFHHRPQECRNNKFGPLASIHVANAFQHEDCCDEFEISTLIDLDYLEKVNLENRLPKWREACQTIDEA